MIAIVPLAAIASYYIIIIVVRPALLAVVTTAFALYPPTLRENIRSERILIVPPCFFVEQRPQWSHWML